MIAEFRGNAFKLSANRKCNGFSGKRISDSRVLGEATKSVVMELLVTCSYSDGVGESGVNDF